MKSRKKVACPECGIHMDRLVSHLKQKHGMDDLEARRIDDETRTAAGLELRHYSGAIRMRKQYETVDAAPKKRVKEPKVTKKSEGKTTVENPMNFCPCCGYDLQTIHKAMQVISRMS